MCTSIINPLSSKIDTVNSGYLLLDHPVFRVRWTLRLPVLKSIDPSIQLQTRIQNGQIQAGRGIIRPAARLPRLPHHRLPEMRHKVTITLFLAVNVNEI